MIANIQRALLAAWLAALLATVSALLLGTMPAALAIALLSILLFGHALVLAAEFAWMARAEANRAGGAPELSVLARAWIVECLHAPLVFLWRQPLQHGRWPDHIGPETAGQRGVVLVHGYFCNRALWNAWMARLRREQVPYVAVDLEPPFGSIDALAERIAPAVQILTQRTGQPPLVVAHSMGGLAVRRWWAQHRPDAIHHLVTLGTPHQGTRLARLGFTTNARQMRERSRWLLALAHLEGPERRQRITCVYSRCDNIVFPSRNAVLDGARSVELVATPHVAMVDHPAVWQLVSNLLRTSPARPGASDRAPCSRTAP